ncbi:MAG: outer membrane protein assembly factor BamD, partial [Acidobacteriota bacterium]
YQVGACLYRQAEKPGYDQDFAQRALDHFEQMVRDVPATDPWGFAARMMLARAQDRLAEHEWLDAQFYYKRRKFRGAIGRMTGLIDNFPRSIRREWAFLELARSYQRVGDVEMARLTLDRMREAYPDGELQEQRERLARELSVPGSLNAVTDSVAPALGGE